MNKKRVYSLAANSLCLAFVLFLLCSCLSFNIADWPSSFVYPNNSPIANLCGPVGAFFAYYLLYFIGPGVYVLLLSIATYFGVRIANQKISQFFFRVSGMVLVTVAASATFYFFWPNSVYKFPVGSGGILGIAITHLMKTHLAIFGTFIIIFAAWVVGLLLLADNAVINLLLWISNSISKTFAIWTPVLALAQKTSHVFGEIWQKIRFKPSYSNVNPQKLDLENDVHLENHMDPRQNDILVNNKQKAKSKDSKKTSSNQEKPYIPPSYKDYVLPPLELLEEPQFCFASVQNKVVKAKSAALEKLLTEFNINASVVAADTGPVVTMFELELSAGVKVSQISNLSNDIARALGAGAVRVVAPLPGKHTIGIEVPNNEKEKVRIKDLMQLAGQKPKNMQIPLYLGKDSAGQALVSDLTSMPHLLIAGTTGSGKSVCINSIITSVLLTKRPDEVKMILIDPKMVEMTAFNAVPHLMCPIVTETQRAAKILEWATVKMDERYALLAEARVKNITEYNELGPEEIINRFNPTTEDEEAQIPKKIPYIVIIIDELADLMMTAAKEIEAYIVRLAQKSRAVGIHLVLATQRPQATVVTGLIKSNMPCRIGFRVAARMDSRIILDQNGAEALLGQGDMLFLKPGTSDLIRSQGAFLDDQEVRRIVKHLKDIAEPQFHPELQQLGKLDPSQMIKDDLFDDAVRVVLDSKRGSVSLLQRRLSIGYARASRIIEMMAASGILGEYKGSQAREVLMTLEEYERIREQMLADAADGYADMAEEEDHEQEQPKDNHPHYVSEGQREYAALEDD